MVSAAAKVVPTTSNPVLLTPALLAKALSPRRFVLPLVPASKPNELVSVPAELPAEPE